MKTPAEYVAAAAATAPVRLGPRISTVDAERAVAACQADAAAELARVHRYHELLAAAIRNAKAAPVSLPS